MPKEKPRFRGIEHWIFLGHADVPGEAPFDVYESGDLAATEKKVAMTRETSSSLSILPLDYLRKIMARGCWSHPAWGVALALYDGQIYDDDPSVSPNA